MSRPLRIEFAGALYHMMARGNARAAIGEHFGLHYATVSRIALLKQDLTLCFPSPTYWTASGCSS